MSERMISAIKSIANGKKATIPLMKFSEFTGFINEAIKEKEKFIMKEKSLTTEQKNDVLKFLSEIVKSTQTIEPPNQNLYDDTIECETDSFDSITIYLKNRYPIGFSDNLSMNHFLIDL
ncbi:hypothetical protein [Xenorhabdus sp. KK7.4]|uniref:hypothetical protein n=1 Tax=Xenorhabdus sp. KK7.4 TaxID=1851572 RepID=UPI000C04EB0D|nr:hypothetical protein [Xenorhabdus sp. KK7.4]PHM51262.1 hypothetical protein Xekk_03835 [Xenorhabdus sp. KK7.4]